MKVNKSLMKDRMGKLLTQSMFYEIKWEQEDYVQFTLDGEDKELDNGKKLISLKQRFLEAEDITEYAFAREWLFSWYHWQRICANKLLKKHIDQWREELDWHLQSQAIQRILEQADGDSFQAAKWIAERGWDKRGRGRPSKQQVQEEAARQARIDDEFDDDFRRLKVV